MGTIRIWCFEAENADAATMRQLMELVESRHGRGGTGAPAVRVGGTATAAAATAPTAPAKHYGRGNPRRYRLSGFPGQTFTGEQVRSMFGMGPRTALSTYVKQGLKVGRKHTIEFADDAPDADGGHAAGLKLAGDGEQGGNDGEAEGQDDEGDPPAGWPESRLWTELKRSTGDRQILIRNAIVQRYMGLVRTRAEIIVAKLPGCVQVADLVSAGVFGLIDAIESFEPARGVRFTTYAPIRVHGAIMDELREYDPVPRLVRTRQAKLERLESAFVSAHGRAPEPAEIAGELGLSDGEVGKLIADGRASRYLSIHEPAKVNGRGDVTTHADLLPDARLEEAGESADREAWWGRMCEGLDRADRLIVVMYFRENLNMREIGRALGFCESRVSQRLKAILARLKSRLTGEPETFPRSAA